MASKALAEWVAEMDRELAETKPDPSEKDAPNHRCGRKLTKGRTHCWFCH